MVVDDDQSPGGRPGAAGEPFALDRALPELYRVRGLTPILHALLEQSGRAIGSVAGSISVVDWDAGEYSKLAERGIPCRLGGSFPLDEGATGCAVSRRRPVVIEDYGRLPSSHLPPGHPAGRGGAVAVPIWWRGELIGVNVAFTGERRRFSARELDGLELLTEAAAGAIVLAGAGDPVLARSRADDRVVVRPSGPRAGERRPPARAPRPGAGPARGASSVVVVPVAPLLAWPVAAPLTTREAEVLALLAEGLGDRDIAVRLVLSRKTVEKHVGSVLRKTGTSSRTAAVVEALRHGWAPADDRAARGLTEARATALDPRPSGLRPSARPHRRRATGKTGDFPHETTGSPGLH
ncbi:LuxR C-terminal-related transcriptional regulator [Actinotalea sp. AC32]|nr:LuxR C-terminal-related transcriptional regulator [Actinotalea sp. AC32]